MKGRAFFPRWKRSKNDPSLVNTLAAFDFGFWTRLGVPVRQGAGQGEVVDSPGDVWRLGLDACNMV